MAGAADSQFGTSVFCCPATIRQLYPHVGHGFVKQEWHMIVYTHTCSGSYTKKKKDIYCFAALHTCILYCMHVYEPAYYFCMTCAYDLRKSMCIIVYNYYMFIFIFPLDVNKLFPLTIMHNNSMYFFLHFCEGESVLAIRKASLPKILWPLPLSMSPTRKIVGMYK